MEDLPDRLVFPGRPASSASSTLTSSCIRPASRGVGRMKPAWVSEKCSQKELGVTLPKTNMDPNNHGLEGEFPFQLGAIFGVHVSFPGVYFPVNRRLPVRDGWLLIR